MYMPQLDALRALAVTMVIANHWHPRFQSFWFNGYLGVSLFFVTSGFLITGILLDLRTRSEDRGYSLRAFYIRRVLRIFPVYYLTLLFLYVADSSLFRDSVLWHAAYLTNVWFARLGYWAGEFCRFWTLAVEEQFYLVWPLVVLFLPRRALLPLLLALIAMSLELPEIQRASGLSQFSFSLLPLQQAPTLAMGGLFAWLSRRESGEAPRTLRLAKVLAVLGIIAWVTTNKFLGCILALGGIVYWASRGFGGPLGRLLESKPLVTMGRLSYGIYLFHGLIKWRMEWSFWRPYMGFTLQTPFQKCLALALNLAVLWAVASLSWRFFEKPINDLKSRYPYFPPGPKESSSPPNEENRATDS